MYPGTYAADTPDRPAIVMTGTGESRTFAQLDERSARLADHLREAGLTTGDVVAVVATNALEYLEVYWACLRSGLYMTGVNHGLTPDELRYILENSGARALFASADRAEQAARAAAGLDAIVTAVAWGGAVQGYDEFEAVIAQASPDEPADRPRGADMLYSSGTTGRPKGIKPPLPPRQVDEPGDPLIAAFGGMYGFDTDTVYLSSAPLYHAAPLRFCGFVLSLGGTVLVMPTFEAEAALAAIERHRATHSQWVPTMFVRMLKLPDEIKDRYDVSSMRVAIHAAAPCPADVKQAMIDWWGPVLHEYYGSTEANGITFIGPEQWLEKRGSVGKAAIGIVRICGDDGRELPAGEVGDVYFEREELPFTYHGDPERTREAQHPEHETWTTCGDVGYLDEDGFLFLTDRRKFTIISGGVNIYPQETEDALALHPDVYDLAVVGVPDEEMGEKVLAVVHPAEGATPGDELAQRLEAHLREHVAGYKVPRVWEFTTDLPRTPTGKLVKGELQQRYAEVAVR